ncbi:uncharacterized protein LOC123550398 [Mercenaria mercenaria]|uniref:uncharacterized protein LOC123550398 n=1 Tax=Mercenaria mercenaria TaxID=6596 RepID=UPI00234EC62D|nr:uncharacterized protein LOC123550398 [Mercenaria mercenaria]
MGHQEELQKKKYRNWVRGGLAYKYLKEGIKGFADDVVNEEHRRINQDVISGRSCNQCTNGSLRPLHPCQKDQAGKNKCSWGQNSCNCLYTKKKQCPNKVCNVIMEEILKIHASAPPSPNWKNTDMQKWCSDPWEIAKCFIKPPGYSDKSGADNIDISGLLHVFINNISHKTHLSDSSDDIFLKLLQGRNELFHSPTMEMEDSKLGECIDDIIAILEDEKELKARHDAQEAVLKLKQLKLENFIITTHNEVDVCRDALTSITNKTEELKQTIQEAKDDIAKKQAEATEAVGEETKKVLRDALGESDNRYETLYERVERLELDHSDTKRRLTILEGKVDKLDIIRQNHQKQLDYVEGKQVKCKDYRESRMKNNQSRLEEKRFEGSQKRSNAARMLKIDEYVNKLTRRHFFFSLAKMTEKLQFKSRKSDHHTEEEEIYQNLYDYGYPISQIRTIIRKHPDRQTIKDTAEDDLDEVKQTENQDDVITKELYLCGNCSEGFASIQACKDHMTNVHEVTDFQTSCRVDAGTQVEPKKKPGRKKKSELIEQIKTEPEEIVMSESDEDWAEQLMSYSTRSRRKRKPPQALKNDYYLGRTKRKEQKKREPKDLNTKCEKEGCTLRFKDEETMRQHLQCHIDDAGVTGPQFKCTACEETFDTWRVARIHMWKIHRISIDMISCPLCDLYKTDAPSKLKIHLETHGSERPYACPVCGKAFKQFAQMKNHETCHLSQDIVNSKEMSDRWHTPKTCNICGRRFVNVKCMKKHKEVVHGGKKDFKCTYCSYECSRKAMLVLHLRIHTGHKPFKCDQCSYCCGDHNSLRRHKMRHTGQKPYRCPHCPYASIQAISLKVHVKNKHPGMGGIYCCEWCLYKTVNKQQFENHQMDHKNGLIKTEPNVKEVQLDLSKFPQAKRPGTMIIGSNLPTVYTSIPAENRNILQVLQTHVPHNSNVQEVLQSHVTQNSDLQEVIETSGTQPVLHTPSLILDEGQVSHFHLQMNENGENVTVEEFANEGLAPNDVAAAQLVYSALTAISQNPQNGKDVIDSEGLVAGVERGEIQTSIETNLKEGVTTHTVTFHLPEGEEITREVTLQDQNESKDGINVIQISGVNEWQESGTITELQQET